MMLQDLIVPTSQSQALFHLTTFKTGHMCKLKMNRPGSVDVTKWDSLLFSEGRKSTKQPSEAFFFFFFGLH